MRSRVLEIWNWSSTTPWRFPRPLRKQVLDLQPLKPILTPTELRCCSVTHFRSPRWGEFGAGAEGNLMGRHGKGSGKAHGRAPALSWRIKRSSFLFYFRMSYTHEDISARPVSNSQTAHGEWKRFCLQRVKSSSPRNYSLPGNHTSPTSPTYLR